MISLTVLIIIYSFVTCQSDLSIPVRKQIWNGQLIHQRGFSEGMCEDVFKILSRFKASHTLDSPNKVSPYKQNQS